MTMVSFEIKDIRGLYFLIYIYLFSDRFTLA